jgi:EAL domain-containing protein (putative c-di-GMP-specific phosphodiesterase class I)/CheY-like chemotaxis protein
MSDPNPSVPLSGHSRGAILVADDDESVRFVIAETLIAEGYEVQEATDGEQALTHLHARRFDAVVSDISMPRMTGVDLLRRIRALDLDLPVILLTGRPTLETAIDAVEAGALRYLQKPVSTRALAALLAEAVRLCRLARWKREALAYLGDRQHLLADRPTLEWTLDEALRDCWLAAQPIVRATGGSVFAHELLLRSRAPRLATPGAVFDAAERLGRVREVGRVVRRLAAAVPAAGCCLFINVHPLELADEELYSAETLLGRRAGAIVLEITERGSLESVSGLEDRVRRLRELGYRLAVDDLGAGYAALNSFAALRPDVAKLDMSLVRGVDRDPYRRRLIGSVTDMCRDLGIATVAEGVETPDERATLVDLGCDLLQGFLIGRPCAPVGPSGGGVDTGGNSPRRDAAGSPATGLRGTTE